MTIQNVHLIVKINLKKQHIFSFLEVSILPDFLNLHVDFEDQCVEFADCSVLLARFEAAALSLHAEFVCFVALAEWFVVGFGEIPQFA